LLCGFAAGIVPALQVSLAEPLDVLRECERSATSGVARQRLRAGFVVMQIALAFILMVSAGLMMSALFRLALQPLGFDPDNLLTVEVKLPETKFRRPTDRVLPTGSLEMRIDEQVQLTSEEIRVNIASIAGVSSASAIAIHPPNSGALNMPIRLPGSESQ